MDEKEIWKNLQKTYGKNKLDGDETFGPMLPPDFYFKKHYIPLMENYKAALWKLDELESENQRLREELRLCANWMHHGGLLEGIAYTEVRRITLPYWDKEECNALQNKQPCCGRGSEA